jgi:hypothetical protein
MARWIVGPFAAAVAVLAAGSASSDILGLPLTGRYVVVGLRAASDVSTSDAMRENDPSSSFIGSELDFGDRVSWYREECDVRSAPQGHPGVADPNLADLQVVAGATDRRLNAHLTIDCLGRAITDIWDVLVVDDRVLVARTVPRATYLIFEKPLAPGDVVVLKRLLRKAGYDPGQSEDSLDAAARLAIADYAAKHGAKRRLLPGILTRSVMDALHENASP